MYVSGLAQALSCNPGRLLGHPTDGGGARSTFLVCKQSSVDLTSQLEQVEPLAIWDYRIMPHFKLGLWDYTPFEIGITGLQDPL